MLERLLQVSGSNRKSRVNWCRGKLACSINQYWRKVIIFDETLVVVGNDKRIHVWRKANEMYRPECVDLRHGAKISVMFCGCITYDGVRTLTCINGTMASDTYIQTLENDLWPVVAKHFPNSNYIFQDNNAPCHKSNRAMAWKRDNHIPTLTLVLPVPRHQYIEIPARVQNRSNQKQRLSASRSSAHSVNSYSCLHTESVHVHS